MQGCDDRTSVGDSLEVGSMEGLALKCAAGIGLEAKEPP